MSRHASIGSARLDLSGLDDRWSAGDYAHYFSTQLRSDEKLWPVTRTGPFQPKSEVTDPIIVVTAGNSAFRPIVLKLLQNAQCLDLPVMVYDLGGLGIGQSRPVASQAFHRDGRYCKLANGWPSKGLHKPDLIADALSRMIDERSLLIYLDGDALPVANMIELTDSDFDIAVVRRPDIESKTDGSSFASEIGQVNAGVLMFRPTPATQRFIGVWMETMNRVGSDQLALNRLLPAKLIPGEVREADGLRIAVLPGAYNVAYPPANSQNGIATARVLHFKAQSWRRYAAFPHLPTLIVPDHRREALAMQWTGPMLDSQRAQVILDGAPAARLGDLSTALELCDSGWELKKVFLDDKAEPTFWLGRSTVTS